MNAMTANTDPVSVVRGILAAADAGRDHFSILALTPSASATEVRDQYFRLAKLVHPDLPYFLKNPQARQDATRAFQVITTAHQTLADPGRRAAYIASQQARLVDAQEADPSVPVNAEVARIFVHRGKSCLVRRDWAGAQEALTGAAKVLAGDELADCQIALGVAIFNNTANHEMERIETPRDLWQTVMKSHAGRPLAAQAAYQLAIWTKIHGDVKDLAKLLDTVLAIQPSHIEAQREKRLLEQRKGSVFSSASNRKPSAPDNARSSSTGNHRRVSSSGIPAADKKVGLEKKPSIMERLFGKKM